MTTNIGKCKTICKERMTDKMKDMAPWNTKLSAKLPMIRFLMSASDNWAVCCTLLVTTLSSICLLSGVDRILYLESRKSLT